MSKLSRFKINRITFLLGLIATILVFNIQNFIGLPHTDISGKLLVFFSDLITLVATIVLFLGRLRDLDKSPLYLLILLVPLMNIALLFYCLFWEGNISTGPDWYAFIKKHVT